MYPATVNGLKWEKNSELFVILRFDNKIVNIKCAFVT